jgi:hypothetical protein
LQPACMGFVKSNKCMLCFPFVMVANIGLAL